MSGAHGRIGPSGAVAATAVHETAAAVKIVCLVALLFAVVVTPATSVWAFAVYAVLVAGAGCVARLPLRVASRALAVEVPFVVFALALPFAGTDPRVEVLGVSVSVAGLWGAWAILAKATLGTAATAVLASTSSAAEICAGLERLHVPRPLTSIAVFAVRYLDVVTAELGRLQVARVSRCDDPRWFWQGRAVAATAGSLVARAFERAERVNHAMVARGFTGTFPAADAAAEPLRWFPAVVLPLAAWVVAATALVLR